MRVLLTAIGTAGDSHPVLRLAHTLAQRGHAATMIGSGYFRPFADELDVPLVDVLSHDEYLARQRQRTDLKGRARLDAMVSFLMQDMRRVHAALTEHLAQGPAVVVAQNLQFGARVLRDERPIPLATVHVETLLMTCSYDAASPWPGSSRLLKPWLNRFAGWLGDRVLAGQINEFRKTRGLGPVRDVLNWWNSPDLVLGLFPDWFGPRAEDVPGNARVVGFPLSPAPDFAQRAKVESFLTAGPPPIAFGQTTSLQDVGKYFDISAAAARQAGYRAILLGNVGGDPARFGVDVGCFESVPHDWLLPRCAALVHHGGIGTAAAALQAGIPQLVIPQISDQGDNSRRLAKLGVARVRNPNQYHVSGVANDLQLLLADVALTARCKELAGRKAGYQGLDAAAVEIERLAATAGLA